jgi:hypothetical protein
MKTKLLLLAGASTLALAGAAVAGQPVRLSDAQMDRLVAGGLAWPAAWRTLWAISTPRLSPSHSAPQTRLMGMPLRWA